LGAARLVGVAGEVEPIRAFVALGSNLGDRAANLNAAIERLLEAGVDVVRVSRFYENPAVGGPAGSPDFLNAVAEVRTTLEPHALLDRLLAVEAELGRVRTVRWAPRTIDLDIILYADRVIQSPRLTVPHPQMHLREFVLAPLAEIAPEAVHPVLKATAREMLDELKSNARPGLPNPTLSPKQ